MSTTANALSQFSGKKYMSIETYRRNGKPVRTPVWLVEENGELFVRTDSDTGKIRRIRRNNRVRVVPSNARGTPKGNWVDGEARIVNKETMQHVSSLMKKKYGMTYKLVRFMGRFSRSSAKPVVLAVRLLGSNSNSTI